MDRVRAACAARGVGLGDALGNAGVSRNAFYTLARRDCVVPRSILQLAQALDVPVSSLLVDAPSEADRMISHAKTAARIADERGGDADNLRHTLILLDEPPWDRLRRALRRGQQHDFR